MTLIKNKVQVDTNIFTKSMNAVANNVMTMALEIVYKRNLDPSYILTLRSIIEEGLYVWLHEQTLLAFFLEVSLPDSPSALERWDFEFEYRDDPDSEVHQAPTTELIRLCETLKSLPPGSKYRVVARKAPGAKKVEGWSPTTLKELYVTTEHHIGQLGFGYIAGQLVYRGGTW